MKKIAALFPGQGSQQMHMGVDLYRNFLCAREVYDEIDHILKRSLSKIIFSGNIIDLSAIINIQLAITSTSIAITKVLCFLANKKFSEIFTVIAGHSLGEYTALYLGHSINIDSIVKLLQYRGHAMSAAVHGAHGTMHSLLENNLGKILQFCANLSKYGLCQLSNDNGAGQNIISGHNTSFVYIYPYTRLFKISKAVQLPVNIPFHSNVMQIATGIMTNILKQHIIDLPNIYMFANLNASIYKNIVNVTTLLGQQVINKVKWRQVIDKMYHNIGCRVFVEIGPGNIISNLLKRQYGDIRIYTLSNIADIRKFLDIEF